MAETSKNARPLSQEETAWVRRAIDKGWKADVIETCFLCAECPESFMDSPDFAFYAGYCTGRLTQLDRVLEEQSPEKEEAFSKAQDALYAKIGGYTIFEPAVFSCALAFVAPAAVFGLFDGVVWPKEYLDKRPFYMGWFLGQYKEGEESSARVFAMNGIKKVFFDMLASHRRPGGGPSLI